MTNDDPRALLAIYINDHRAAATGGLSLARRAHENNRGSALGDELATIVADLEVDSATLAAVAQRLGVAENSAKRLVTRAGELVSRLKLNGRLHGYSPLSRLLEIESLLAGIDAKRSLWRSLEASADPDLADFDFEAMQLRATDQRSRLIPFHRDAAHVAFASSVRQSPVG